jgi:hypothetical protein
VLSAENSAQAKAKDCREQSGPSWLLVRSLVFGIEPRGVETVGLACGLLVFVAATACYVPARRAARMDAHEALRAE